jgi:hypothetical protein
LSDILAGLTDGRRAADDAGINRVKIRLQARLLGRLDQQRHVVTPVAGNDAIRARRLDL